MLEFPPSNFSMWVNKATAAATMTIDKVDKHSDSSAGAVKIVITKVGTNPDGVDVRPAPSLTLRKGIVYNLTFWAKANTASTTLELNTRMNHAPWSGYGLQTSLQLTTAWTAYSATFTLPTDVLVDSVSDAWLSFFLGEVAGVTVWIDSVKLEVAAPPVTQREFSCGLVILNGSPEPQVVSIPHGYSRLQGSQAPKHQYIVDDASADFTPGAGWQATTCPGETNKQPPLNSHCFVHGYNFDNPSNEENQGPYYHTFEESAHFGASGESTFALKLPEAGKYTLSAWWPAVSPAPTGSLAWNAAVKFVVHDGAGKVLSTKFFNQADAPTNGDRWNVIVANLTLPVTASVSVQCSGHGLCVADAILVESVARLNDGSAVGPQLTVPSLDGAVLAKTSCRHEVATEAAPVGTAVTSRVGIASPLERGCGTVPLSCAPNCGSAIVTALSDCSASGGGTVSLSAGIYIVNDTSPASGPALLLTDLMNVNLVGEAGSRDYYSTTGPDPSATTLMIYGLRGAFSLSNCSNLIVKGVQVDMERQPYTYAHLPYSDPSRSCRADGI
jgi:hypothetical protein